MDFCSYHKERSGLWACVACDKVFCSDCIPGGTANFNQKPLCPLCRSQLQFQRKSNISFSWWKMFGTLGYPFQLFPLVIMALAALIASRISFAGLTALLIPLALLVLYIHYSLGVLQEMAYGRRLAPGLSAQPGEAREPLFIKLIWMYLLQGLGLYVAAHFSSLLAVITMCILTLLLPANIMILAITRSVIYAINPLMLIRVTWNSGRCYLLLLMTASLVVMGLSALFWVNDNSVLPVNYLPLLQAVLVLGVFYFCVVGHAMMGYILYSRRDDLGIETDEPKGKNLPQDFYEIKKVLGGSFVLMAESRNKEAASLVSNACQRFPSSAELQVRMHQILRRGDNQKLVMQHAESCFKLFYKSDTLKIVPIYNKLKSADPSYVLKPIAITEQFALVFMLRSEYSKVIALLNNIESWADGHEKMPLLLLMRGHAELKNKHTCEATRTFEALIRLVPESAEAQEAQELLQQIYAQEPHLLPELDRVQQSKETVPSNLELPEHVDELSGSLNNQESSNLLVSDELLYEQKYNKTDCLFDKGLSLQLLELEVSKIVSSND